MLNDFGIDNPLGFADENLIVAVDEKFSDFIRAASVLSRYKLISDKVTAKNPIKGEKDLVFYLEVEFTDISIHSDACDFRLIICRNQEPASGAGYKLTYNHLFINSCVSKRYSTGELLAAADDSSGSQLITGKALDRRGTGYSIAVNQSGKDFTLSLESNGYFDAIFDSKLVPTRERIELRYTIVGSRCSGEAEIITTILDPNTLAEQSTVTRLFKLNPK
jgi:hypothetical protein